MSDHESDRMPVEQETIRDYTKPPPFERPMIQPDMMRYQTPHYIRRWNDHRAFYATVGLALGMGFATPSWALSFVQQTRAHFAEAERLCAGRPSCDVTREANAIGDRRDRAQGSPCDSLTPDAVMRSAIEQPLTMRGLEARPVAVSGLEPMSNLNTGKTICTAHMVVTFDGRIGYDYQVEIRPDGGLRPLYDRLGSPRPIRLYN